MSYLLSLSKPSQTGGVQVNTDAKIGDNKNKNQAGDEVNAQNNKGKIAGDNQTNYDAATIENQTINNRGDWWQEFQNHLIFVLLFIIFSGSICGITFLFMRSPFDKKVLDDRSRIINELILLLKNNKNEK